MAFSAEDLSSFNRIMKSRSRWRLIAVIAVIFALVSLIAMAGGGADADEDHIARIYINDVIVTDNARAELLQDIAKDENIKAVILRINSPGGTVAGSETLFQNLRLLAKDKPVVAVIDELSASGGYIAALGADHIISRETSIVGSIGVIFQWAEGSKLLDTVGVRFNSIKSDPRKAEPGFDAPLSPEGRAVLEKVVAQSHDWFVGIVAERRNLERAKAREIGDGRIFSGANAEELGLVDTLGGEQAALEWLKSEHTLDDLDIFTHSPDLPGDLQQFLGSQSLLGKIAKLIWRPASLSTQSYEGLMAIWIPG